MLIKQEKLDNYIKRLTAITATIDGLYNDLIGADRNEKKTKEIKGYLDLVISVENKVYKEIGEDLLWEDRFIKRLNYLLYKSDIKNNKLVENRIINYIVQKCYANPFLSTEPFKKDYDEENELIIKNQITIDYVKAILLTIDEELKKDHSQKIRKKLVKAKNSTLFANKFVAEILNDKRNHKIDGRHRCIVFKHNEEKVDELYRNYSVAIIDYSISTILGKDDNILEQIQLKSALKLLTSQEVNTIAYDYYKLTTSTPEIQALVKGNPNHEIIVNILRSFMPVQKNKEHKKIVYN